MLGLRGGRPAEVEQTAHGVLTRPDVAEQWSKGWLVKVPEAARRFLRRTR
ncbi:hypothetical protein ACPB9E_36265 [Streptomyces exfoliatus]